MLLVWTFGLVWFVWLGLVRFGLDGMCAHDADSISHGTQTMEDHAAHSGATVLTMSTRG